MSLCVYVCMYVWLITKTLWEYDYCKCFIIIVTIFIVVIVIIISSIILLLFFIIILVNVISIIIIVTIIIYTIIIVTIMVGISKSSLVFCNESGKQSWTGWERVKLTLFTYYIVNGSLIDLFRFMNRVIRSENPF